MAERSKHTWYVSFKPKSTLPGKRAQSRTTATFPNETDARTFAKAMIADTPHVSAGTLNPHRPKRTVSAAQMLEWLQESADPACEPAPVALAFRR
ncbi:hypothetical protein [Bradyrhizobium sp.]|uniref:hypothetical protein n=1 Tax=Bradyrhizobium sp. TaxID=376 RepID=UPI003C3A7130